MNTLKELLDALHEIQRDSRKSPEELGILVEWPSTGSRRMIYRVSLLETSTVVLECYAP